MGVVAGKGCIKHGDQDLGDFLFEFDRFFMPEMMNIS